MPSPSQASTGLIMSRLFSLPFTYVVAHCCHRTGGGIKEYDLLGYEILFQKKVGLVYHVKA